MFMTSGCDCDGYGNHNGAAEIPAAWHGSQGIVGVRRQRHTPADSPTGTFVACGHSGPGRFIRVDPTVIIRSFPLDTPAGPFANGLFLFFTEFLLTCGHFRRFSDVNKSDLLVFFFN